MFTFNENFDTFPSNDKTTEKLFTFTRSGIVKGNMPVGKSEYDQQPFKILEYTYDQTIQQYKLAAKRFG